MNLDRAIVPRLSRRRSALRATQKQHLDASGWYLLSLRAIDLAAILVAGLLAAELRGALPFGPSLTDEGWAGPAVYGLAVALGAIVYAALGVYRPERLESMAAEAGAVGKATLVTIVLLAGLMYILERDVSRWLFAYFGVLVLALVVGARLLVHGACALFGYPLTRRRRTLIAGAGAIGRSVARHLQRAAPSTYRVLGFVDDAEPAADLEAPLLGTLDRAEAIARAMEVDELLIALPLRRSHAMAQLVSAIQRLPIRVKVIPDYFDLAYLDARSDELAGLPVISLKEPVLTPGQRALKRAFDVVMSAGLMVLAAPLLLIGALTIKLDSPGPVLYRQKRIGEGGRPFHMLKLRTMVVDADRYEDGLIEQDGGSLQFNKAPDDPRVTRAGAFLRRWSIDELPQLWNVMRGDMSLVGPRPELPTLVERYEVWQRKRFSVPQGMTGWWQVNGRPQGVADKVELDLYYVRNYSVWLDLWIVLKTAAAVASRDGAY